MHTVRLLLFIKQKCTFLWEIINTANDFLFMLLYEKEIHKNIHIVLHRCMNTNFTFRLIEEKDLTGLTTFFQRQEDTAFEYFKPHEFDQQALAKLYKSHSFIMFGAYNTMDEIVGYFFLRCFANRKAFRGKIVDKQYRGYGIAKEMGYLLSEICWLSHFRIFATISKFNRSSIASSKAVNTIRIVDELPNDYMHVEYIRQNRQDD